MKIDIFKISSEGLILEEDITAASLDLETEIFKFRQPIRIKADVFLITNALTVDILLDATVYTSCSRCLGDFEINLNKNFRLNYAVNKLSPIVDLDKDIREEIILDYPIKPLCNVNCKGLCLKCGKNFNEGGCSCGST